MINKFNINVAIVGASGFTGLELIKIILQHPFFKISYLATSEGGGTASQLHSSLFGILDLPVKKINFDEIAKTSEIVFLALPHKTAMETVRELMKFPHIKIVDLSADYRLSHSRYIKSYGEHLDLENLNKAVYGLPELFREQIKQARLIANPGCYPTASILAVAPFLKFLKTGDSIIIDAKSGVSGAGKKCETNTHYVTINENMFAYNPLKHRHEPEIEEKLEIFGGEFHKVHFVPHLVPVTRGMLSSVYLRIDNNLELEDPIKYLREFYKNEKFIRIRENPPTMKDVAGTNFCDIFARRNGDLLYVESAIDNLMRGASSQAVLNANLIAGFDEFIGIPQIAIVP